MLKIAIRGNGIGLEYMCPTRHFVYIFFNPVFQVSTAKNEINLFNNHVLIVAPVTFAPAGAMTPSAEFLFLIIIINLQGFFCCCFFVVVFFFCFFCFLFFFVTVLVHLQMKSALKACNFHVTTTCRNFKNGNAPELMHWHVRSHFCSYKTSSFYQSPCRLSAMAR